MTWPSCRSARRDGRKSAARNSTWTLFHRHTRYVDGPENLRGRLAKVRTFSFELDRRGIGKYREQIRGLSSASLSREPRVVASWSISEPIVDRVASFSSFSIPPFSFKRARVETRPLRLRARCCGIWRILPLESRPAVVAVGKLNWLHGGDGAVINLKKYVFDRYCQSRRSFLRFPIAAHSSPHFLPFSR